jgi:hypothetical protein
LRALASAAWVDADLIGRVDFPGVSSSNFQLRVVLLVSTLEPVARALYRHRSLPPYGYGTNFASIAWTAPMGNIQKWNQANRNRMDVSLAYPLF